MPVQQLFGPSPRARFALGLPASLRSSTVQLAALLLAAALLIRLPQFGNTLFGEDEQFYLLVGDRILRGALPYVDIWDRKPFGLFVLFASFRLIGGDGFLVAQIAATLSAAATAFLIALIARRFTPTVPAVGAGVLYLLLLTILGGDAAQTPVFYNLLIAAAAWLILPTDAALAGRRDMARAVGAMLLCGLAIQIKTNAVFEGAALGLWLVVRMWRTVPTRLLLGRATLFALIGLSPTIAVVAGYAGAGHFGAWWFANVQSQLLKEGGLSPDALQRLGSMLPLVAMMGMAAIGGTLRLAPSAERTLLIAWAFCGLADMFVLGNFWSHYALPFTVPVAILSAPLFAIPRLGKMVFLALAAYPLIDSQLADRLENGRNRHILEASLAAMPSDTATRCLLAYEVPAAFYLLTNACLVTPYIFIDQLRSSAEAHALPKPADAAIRDALLRRPGTILTVEGSSWTLRNRVNDAILAESLRRGYRLVAHIPFRQTAWSSERLLVWRRSDLPPR